MTISLCLYLGVGVCLALYMWISYFIAIGILIKQHCTMKYPEPSKIKLYFGFKLWSLWDKDSIWEISSVMLAMTTICSLCVVILWPLTCFFIVNYAINKARIKNFGE